MPNEMRFLPYITRRRDFAEIRLLCCESLISRVALLQNGQLKRVSHYQSNFRIPCLQLFTTTHPHFRLRSSRT